MARHGTPRRGEGRYRDRAKAPIMSSRQPRKAKPGAPPPARRRPARSEPLSFDRNDKRQLVLFTNLTERAPHGLPLPTAIPDDNGEERQ